MSKIFQKSFFIFLFFMFVSASFFIFFDARAQEKININTASLEELDTLPGIGPAKAQAIIDYRETNGPFSVIDDIVNVSGIGSVTFQNIKDLITVGDSNINIPPPSSGEDSVCGNGILEAGEECDDGNLNNGDGCSSQCRLESEQDETEEEGLSGSEDSEEEESTPGDSSSSGKIEHQYKSGDILINEFVSDPADGEVEWIELFNALYDRDIDLNGWYIEEGSGAKTYLKGVIKSSGPEKYFILEKPKGNLNNKGDIIKLFSPERVLIDQVVYGSWENRSNNAPVADDPYSVARKFDGLNTFNNKEDFRITTTPTKGAPNIITLLESEQEISPEERASYDYSHDIIISEIFPDPVGDDSQDEFIELFNQGERSVNLKGWRLGDLSQRKYEFKEDVFIQSKGFFFIKRADSKIALNNGGDEARLFRPLEDSPIQSVKYGKAIEGWSYALDFKTKELPVKSSALYVWTEVVTPGQENVIKKINHPPIVEFYFPEQAPVNTPIFFDSSDTFDPDDDELSFEWDFGDGIRLNLNNPEHGYAKTGIYLVKLTVSDSEHKVSKEKSIKVVGVLDNAVSSSPLQLTEASGRSIVINELLPNPIGNDADGEFIELKNIGDLKVNLLNWSVDDIEGGSRPYKFKSDLWVEPSEFYVLERIESGLALNNDRDQVRLFDNFGELIEELEYEKAVEGESFARGQDGKFYWTSRATPGEENIITVSNSLAYALPKTSSAQTKEKAEKQTKEYVKISLENIREYGSGDLIITQGVVAVKPGVFGSQYFYIIGSPGLQIYNYYKDFPDLEVGDYIEVVGELSELNGEQRLKTKAKDDMVILEKGRELSPQELNCDQVSDEYVGQLISVTGEIIEQKSSLVYLDDGTEELRIYIKQNTGINPKYFKAGEIVSVSGILAKTASGLRLMPRSFNDIIKKDMEASTDNSLVLGEKIINSEWQLAQRNKQLEFFRYLLALAGGVIFLLGGLLVKEFRK